MFLSFKTLFRPKRVRNKESYVNRKKRTGADPPGRLLASVQAVLSPINDFTSIYRDTLPAPSLCQSEPAGLAKTSNPLLAILVKRPYEKQSQFKQYDILLLLVSRYYSRLSSNRTVFPLSVVSAATKSPACSRESDGAATSQ